MQITKYRITYNDENSVLIEHEEPSHELMVAYISNHSEISENINIETIVEDMPNYYLLRVIELLDNDYKFLYPAQICKIDIRKHLRPNLSLKKFLNDFVNGRPDTATYCLKKINEDSSVSWIKIAQIKFLFNVDQNTGLISSRQEQLSFYNTNDEIDEDYVYIISEEIYSFTNPDGSVNNYDIIKMAQENVLTLNNIINDIKMKINLYLVQKFMMLGENYMQAKEHGANLFYKYEKEITTYIGTGSQTFKNAIQSDTEFEWLDDIIVAPNTTIKQLIASSVG